MYMYVFFYVYLNVYASDVCLQRIVTLKNNYYEAPRRNRVKVLHAASQDNATAAAAIICTTV